MDPTEPQDGGCPGVEGAPEAPRPEAERQARARHERRVASLRSNLKRRKAQVRGRAEAGRQPAPD